MSPEKGIHQYSPGERKSGLRILLVYTFFMVTGFTMLMPMVAVHYVNDLGMAATLVGVALALRQITQQGLAIGGGILADLYGTKLMIGLGVTVRAIGFAGLAFADSALPLFIALTVSAVGGALFEAPYQAAIAALTTSSDRTRYYSLSNWVSGVASTVGPLLGAILVGFDFMTVCLVSSALFFLCLVVITRLPVIHTHRESGHVTDNIRLVGQDRRFASLIMLMAGYWIVAVQMGIIIPLQAGITSGSKGGAGIALALSAAITIALQYHLTSRLSRSYSNHAILTAGIVVFSAGMGAIALFQSFSGLLFCVAVISTGAVLVRPTYQAIIADTANPKALGTYLGASSLSLGFGGAIGHITGGALFDLSVESQVPGLPWATFAVIGLITAIALHYWVRRAGVATTAFSDCK
ncbi:MFS transporter [Prosthecochloris sp.]|uniref:MFS transporter n=1 Tax=Prosthecochloris sp. TaxID=290513 RepID=UPI0025D31B77|nr:MFS transporter [Prosthecochloris sp.]